MLDTPQTAVFANREGTASRPEASAALSGQPELISKVLVEAKGYQSGRTGHCNTELHDVATDDAKTMRK